MDSKDVALQRTITENCKQIFPEKALRSHNTNFHIHVSVSDLFISVDWYAIDSKVVALQRTSKENCKQIIPEKALRSHNTNFHIHVSVSDLFISTIDLPILLQEICGPILVVY
jgi:hypothetical protein